MSVKRKIYFKPLQIIKPSEGMKVYIKTRTKYKNEA